MSSKDGYAPHSHYEQDTVPFETAEDVRFWFIAAQAARNDGARLQAGASLTPRPCEPADILKILDRHHRNRRLMMDHLLVLRHYGKRKLSPDPRRSKEVRAFKLWQEALERIEPILVRKGIVRQKKLTLDRPNKFWVHGMSVYENTDMKRDG